jgi:hypothetical protein
MKPSAVLIFTLLAVNVSHATSPACLDTGDKLTKRLDDVKQMVGPSQAKCKALSLLISDLTDWYTECAIKAQDEKFIAETYQPVAKAISDEAPKSCQR